MQLTPNEFADRYVALWNESDPEGRRRRVMEMYAPDAIYAFYRRDPVRGQEAILEQISYTHQLYGPMGYVFRSSHNAVGHHNIIRLNWVMVSADRGELEMAGQDVLVLDDDGRVELDYQFHDRLPTSFAYNDGFEEHGFVTRAARPVRLRP